MARKRRQAGKQRGGHAGRDRRRDSGPAGSPWIYGLHAVLAALGNPARDCERLLVADDTTAEHVAATAAALGRESLVERVGREDIEAFLPVGAVHQNVALLARPLGPFGIGDILEDAGEDTCVLVLDQVTDPQNVGAMIRSAAAFGAQAVIMQDRHAPPLSGALAKAASGGLEHVRIVYETNLARTLDLLKREGFWCMGLDGNGPQTVAEGNPGGRVALVLGAEGSGLRRLVGESCDALVRIPQSGRVESLNVSNAAAVALYEIRRNAVPPPDADTD
ncbi:MAG: 23S rRNA (guanosine(2251)-2'-O)-methyltransferase RlmB [Alphaproteobacteria bacterium]|nr:23S rRNA (guanosine(2251)-2'-O)-methyltransferase RlmB [Alphaproteobacteria bacterium]